MKVSITYTRRRKTYERRNDRCADYFQGGYECSQYMDENCRYMRTLHKRYNEVNRKCNIAFTRMTGIKLTKGGK